MSDITYSNKYTIKCDICGKFCVPHTSGVYYGSYGDEEPPDPIIFCKKCAEKEASEPQIDCWWIKPKS